MRKEVARELMSDATFEVQKWPFNEPQLEDRPHCTPHEEQSYAKHQLQAQSSESKLLGVKWNEEDDMIAVLLSESGDKPIKLHYKGKIFHKLRDSELFWDSSNPDHLRVQFQRW